MTGEFLNIAGALSGEEFAELARYLLSELEVRNVSRSREPEEARTPDSATFAAAAEMLVKAAEKLALTAETPAAGTSAPPETKGAFSRTGAGEVRTEAAAGKTVFHRPDAGGESGIFRYARKEGGSEGLDLEKLSESIRRDARRCDSGFERY